MISSASNFIKFTILFCIKNWNPYVDYGLKLKKRKGIYDKKSNA